MSIIKILSGCLLIIAGVVIFYANWIVFETVTELSYLYSKTEKLVQILMWIFIMIISACVLVAGIKLLLGT